MSGASGPVLAAGLTITGARRTLAAAFRAADLDSPELDAALLVGHALGLDRTRLLTGGEQPLDSAARERIAALAARRLAREPVARILGLKEFWGLSFRVTPDVLVPRPDTETVVEAALGRLDAAGGRDRPLHILDLGTGSGALLAALLHECPQAYGTATDRSIAALQVARTNLAQLGLVDRAHFVCCDFGAALHGPFDLIVSNPPYIAHGEIPRLDPEVRCFDPFLALDGGADGLAAYRSIAADAGRLLAPGGILVVELGQGQAAPVAALFRAAGLRAAAPRRDLGGIERALTAGPGAV